MHEGLSGVSERCLQGAILFNSKLGAAEPTELNRPEGQQLGLEHQLCHGPLSQRELPFQFVVLFEPAGADA